MYITNKTVHTEKALVARVRAGLFLFLFMMSAVWCGAVPALAQEASDVDAKAQLRAQLKEVQDQIEHYQQSIEETKKTQNSLKREVQIIDVEMKKQKLQVKEISLSLQEVETEIREKNNEINSLEDKLKSKKVLLDASLKRLEQYDNTSWIGILFSGASISDFFNQIRYIQNIQNEVNEFITNIDSIRKDLEGQREDLEDKKSDITRLKNLNVLQQSSLEQKQKEKSTLLAKTRGEEKLYTESIKRSQKDITLLRQQLFTLESVGVSMSFEEAIKKAKFSGEKTGIRPAFLLAIFQVESRLGTYVGGGSWKKDMKPAERPLFQKITTALGLDPDAMPVSKKPWYGWGGAMGAAQFIPSTWLSYADQVAALTGHNPPSPWNIEDAFIASGLKLVGNGAGGHTYQGEHTAAAKYIAGGNYKKSVGQAYANNVMDWADHYQKQIDVLSGVGTRDAYKIN